MLAPSTSVLRFFPVGSQDSSGSVLDSGCKKAFYMLTHKSSLHPEREVHQVLEEEKLSHVFFMREMSIK